MNRLPAFSVILVFAVLSIVGAGVIPLLDIRYSPSEKGKSISLSYSWNDASAKLLEKEVTSKLEGMVVSVSGIESIESISRKGRGAIHALLKSNADIQNVRLQISSLIRRIYPKLPDGVTYPELSVGIQGEKRGAVMMYTINSSMPTLQIEQYVKDNIVKELALIDGVSSVNISGVTPFHTVIEFNPDELDKYGLNSNDIAGAIRNTEVIPNDVTEWENLPIKRVGGRIINLGDISSVDYREQPPASYYRINGLNTINLSVLPADNINTIELCESIRDRMEKIQKDFPHNFSATIVSDASTDIEEELGKIVRRIVISLVILLLFVYLTARSIAYLLAITSSLLCNIFISCIFYAIFGVDIHIYSLAGITVSLGIVIDTAIIMIAHYSYYRHRNIITALMAALLTSVGSLAVIYLLPEEQQLILGDFASVIMINLTVSLFVAMFFVPALVDKFNISFRGKAASVQYLKRVSAISDLYNKYIVVARKYRWGIIVLLVIAFGLPVDKLPDKYHEVRKPLYAVLGGSYKFFKENSRGDMYRNITRPALYITASLPQGCTVQQLNDIVKVMENHLSQYEEIESFRTNVVNVSNASITVNFKKEYENTMIPAQIKSEVIKKANDYGGANWFVYGVDEGGFSNMVGESGRSNSLKLYGYNIDMLYDFAINCAGSISKNQRVKDVQIYGYSDRREARAVKEYFIDYDKYILSGSGFDYSSIYGALQNRLSTYSVGYHFKDNVYTSIDLESEERDSFDVWNLSNEYVVSDGQSFMFSSAGEIKQEDSGINIYKENQQYSLTVAFNYIGDTGMALKLVDREVERLNKGVLPVGFMADSPQRNPYGDLGSSENLLLLLIVIAIIFFMCAVLFESLLLPLLVIMMIPVSFIGVFLIFGFTGCSFDQGGYASLIMLSGLVVNAAIYMLYEYRGCQQNITGYIKGFNKKIIPISLTVISTVLGLVPFLLDGPDEVFWFAFALGTIGGLLFSIFALVFVLPAFIRMKKRLNLEQ